MEFLIVTGMSGSGKSTAINALEDAGYFCVDNLLPQLIGDFADIILTDAGIEKAAVVTDIRGGSMFLELPECMAQLRDRGLSVKLLYVDATTDEIFRRYKETRRRHPLIEAAKGDLAKAIAAEAEILTAFRKMADYCIDTTHIIPAKMRETIRMRFTDNPVLCMSVTCMSFGFMKGLPSEADLVFDLRCLPNPYWDQELRRLTGESAAVRDYVMSSEKSMAYEAKLRDLLEFLLPEYAKEGRSQVVIAFGCTGGKHRSVTFAHRIGEYLKEKGYSTVTMHRDLS
jgi:UPF0042 nucleotide-binding protein